MHGRRRVAMFTGGQVSGPPPYNRGPPDLDRPIRPLDPHGDRPLIMVGGDRRTGRTAECTRWRRPFVPAPRGSLERDWFFHPKMEMYSSEKERFFYRDMQTIGCMISASAEIGRRRGENPGERLRHCRRSSAAMRGAGPPLISSPTRDR